MTAQAPTDRWSWPTFLALTLLQLWAAHALVFFAHEYAHSFTAWALGWKHNPFDYAHPSLTVFLIQLGINQNVNETPIFATGHGTEAALIAGAGAVLGNGLLSFPLSRWAFAVARRHGHRAWAMFAFWCTVASIGNFLDYIPIRTFTFESDMGSVQRGFGWSPWTLLVVLGIPTALAVLYFFIRIEPSTGRWLFPDSPARRILLAVLTAAALFAFYGAAGWSEGGPVSHRLSVFSVTILAPAMALLTALRASRPAPLVSRPGLDVQR